MQCTTIQGCTITHTGRQGDPISLGKSTEHRAVLYLNTLVEPPEVKAVITHLETDSTYCRSIMPLELAELFRRVKEQEVTGLIQPHVANELCAQLDQELAKKMQKAG